MLRDSRAANDPLGERLTGTPDPKQSYGFPGSGRTTAASPFAMSAPVAAVRGR